MSLAKNTLKKHERLRRKQLIDHVFLRGYKLFEYPILFRWSCVELPTNYPVQVLIGVSKKRFKKAAARNRIKRLVREAYRTNKHIIYPLLEKNNEQMALAINFVGKKMPTYKETEQKIIILLQRLARDYEES